MFWGIRKRGKELKTMNLRQINLVEDLLRQNKYVTVTELAGKYEVSKRTIHYDLSEIAVLLQEHELYIDKKRNAGIKISGKKDDFIKTQEMLSRVISRKEEIMDRKDYIFDVLFRRRRAIKLQELADKFYVSKSSIIDNLDDIKRTLAKLESIDFLVDRNGTRVNSDNLKIQNAIVEYQLDGFHCLYGKQGKLGEFKEYLKTTYDNIFLSKVVNILDSYFDTKDTTIAEHYRINIYNELITLFFQIYNSNHIGEDFAEKYNYKELLHLETYTIAAKILKEISELTGVEVKDNDTKYLDSVFIANGIRVTAIAYKNNPYIENIVIKLVKKVSDLVHIDLNYDATLRESLVAHFIPMIYRNKHRSTIRNPIMDEIIKEYSVLFSLIFFALSELDEPELRDLPRDEISFLLVYFQAAIEKSVKRKKVLLVCPHGSGTNELLLFKLRRYLPPIEIDRVHDIEQMDCRELEKYMFVISTVSLNLVGIDVVRISPLLTDEELQHLNSYFLREAGEVKRGENLVTDGIIGNYISENSVHVDKEFKSSREILQYLSTLAEKDGVAKKGFLENMLKREEIEPTSLWSGVAIPHASPKYVHKTKIYVVSNKTPIEWGDNKIKLVFMICISEDSLSHSKEIVSSLRKLIGSKEKAELFMKKDKKTKISILKGRKKL